MTHEFSEELKEFHDLLKVMTIGELEYYSALEGERATEYEAEMRKKYHFPPVVAP